MSDHQGEIDDKQIRAVATLMARVPSMAPLPRPTQWVESDQDKTDPSELY